jgi:hypothetical protein
LARARSDGTPCIFWYPSNTPGGTNVVAGASPMRVIVSTICRLSIAIASAVRTRMSASGLSAPLLSFGRIMNDRYDVPNAPNDFRSGRPFFFISAAISVGTDAIQSTLPVS